ncbi:MAG: alpha/beta hydrolase [Lacrimispora sphenoides]
MDKEFIKIENIPVILWGTKSDSIYIYVHGKNSNKEEANSFAEKAVKKGFQVLSFDLPEHGERINEDYHCVVWNGIHDLNIIGAYVHQSWVDIYLYGSSLGAYFSLLAYKDMPLKKCLFLSPILDMERLIQNMMKWFNVSEEVLKEKQEIQTPIGEMLNWDYYCYVRNNPINRWNVSTAILFGSEDNLTEREIVEDFAKRFDCDLTVLDGGEHWFHTEKQLTILDKWLDKQI